MVGKQEVIADVSPGITSALPVIQTQSLSVPHRTLYVLPITELVDVMGSREWPSRLTDIVVRHRVSTILPRLRAAMLLKRRRFVGLHH